MQYGAKHVIFFYIVNELLEEVDYPDDCCSLGTGKYGRNAHQRKVKDDRAFTHAYTISRRRAKKAN